VGKYSPGTSAMVTSPAMVTYKNYEYRTLAGTPPLSTSTQGQDSLIEMPAGGWMLAPNDAASKKVTVAYPWGTTCVVFGDGNAITTSSFGAWGGYCGDDRLIENRDNSVVMYNVKAFVTGFELGQILIRRRSEDSPQSGATSCQDCVAGKYLATEGASSASACLDCGAGGYSNATGVSACQLCPVGKHSTTLGANTSSTCISCVAGKYQATEGASSASACLDCGAGGYSNATGVSACQLCPMGTYSTTLGANTSSTCTSCVAGKYSATVGASSASTCINCAAGTHSAFYGATAMATCVPCSAGTYSSEMGASLCLGCGAGTYSNTTGVSACLLCGIGKYASALGVSVCPDCTSGKYSAIEGMSNCTDCTAGKYNNDTGLSACQLCPAGKYSTTLGASSETTCVPCAKDSNSTSGSVNITECLCNPGYSGNDGGPCQACTVGTYKPGKGSVCVRCEAGKYVDFVAAVSCLPCPVHSQSAEGSGNISLCLCNSGYVVRDEAGCIACVAGKYGSNNGTCSECDAGKFAAAGASVCTICVAGSWSSGGAATCYDTRSTCELGSIRPSDTSLCTPCEAGKFGTYSASGERICQYCTPGKYQNATGKINCIDCPAGNWSIHKDLTDLKNASKTGSWTDIGATECTESCTVGSVYDYYSGTCVSCAGSLPEGARYFPFGTRP
jgi:hypothetical protein